MQTTYSAQPARAFAGMLDAMLEGASTLSRFNEESASIPYGVMVAQGTAENQIANLSGTGDDFLGVTIHEHTEIDSAGEAAEIEADGGKASILRKGRIWVVVEEAIALTNDVYFRHTAAGAEVLGAFRTDADTADADQLTNARWLTTTSGAGVALLEINLP